MRIKKTSWKLMRTKKTSWKLMRTKKTSWKLMRTKKTSWKMRINLFVYAYVTLDIPVSKNISRTQRERERERVKERERENSQFLRIGTVVKNLVKDNGIEETLRNVICVWKYYFGHPCARDYSRKQSMILRYGGIVTWIPMVSRIL